MTLRQRAQEGIRRLAPGYFALVMASGILSVGMQLQGFAVLSAALLAVCAVAWVVLVVLTVWRFVAYRRALYEEFLDPRRAFLDPVVSSASGRHALSLVAVGCWSVGLFLYASAGVLVALRMMLYPLSPKDLTPPYWVAMGACAITVLAASRIVEMTDTPMMAVMRELVAGMGVLFWAFATWLIPALTAAGWWRHRIHRIPLVYDPTLWSVIFPLGMFAVASIYLGRADSLPIVGLIGAGWLWVAFAAWALVFTSMVVHLVRRLLLGRPLPDQVEGTRGAAPS